MARGWELLHELLVGDAAWVKLGPYKGRLECVCWVVGAGFIIKRLD